MTTAYPLAWPPGWPRTPAAQQVDGRYQFKKVAGDGWRKPYTFAQARDALFGELGRMTSTGLVLSSNFQLNASGEPRGDRGRPADEGIAIYFFRKGKALAMACDRYTRAEENMNSLRLALEAMRQLERHGGGLMAEKAFTGFTALPAPGAQQPQTRSWRQVLGFAPDFGGMAGGLAPDQCTLLVRSKYRELAMRHRDNDALLELNLARDAALKEIGG